MEMSLCIVLNAKQDLSLLQRDAIVGQGSILLLHVGMLPLFETPCLEHQNIAFHCSNNKLGFEVPVRGFYFYPIWSFCSVTDAQLSLIHI